MARITRMTKRRLGEMLQAEGLVNEEQIRLAIEEQRKSNLFLGEALVKLGFLTEEAIAITIVQQFTLPFISAHQYNISADVLNIFPERMYYEYQFIALDKIAKTLIIAGAGLMNHDMLDELERLSGCKVCQYVSTWKDIRSSLDAHAKDLRKEQSELSSLGSMLLDSSGGLSTLDFNEKDAQNGASHAEPLPAAAPAVVHPAQPVAPARLPDNPIFKPQAVPPAAAAQQPAPAASKLQPPTTPRMTALIKPAPKPPSTAAPDTPPAKVESGRNPPAKPGTGLLGLFRKPQ